MKFIESVREAYDPVITILVVLTAGITVSLALQMYESYRVLLLVFPLLAAQGVIGTSIFFRPKYAKIRAWYFVVNELQIMFIAAAGVVFLGLS